MPRTDVVAAVSAAVWETGLDHGVLRAAGLPHPAQVTEADSLRAGAMMWAAPVQTVAWKEKRSESSFSCLVSWTGVQAGPWRQWNERGVRKVSDASFCSSPTEELISSLNVRFWKYVTPKLITKTFNIILKLSECTLESLSMISIEGGFSLIWVWWSPIIDYWSWESSTLHV